MFLKSWRWKLVALAILAIALHFETINNKFTFDDPTAILSNPTVRKPWDIAAHVKSGFFGPDWKDRDAAWRPFTTITFAWNYMVHGTSPAGYHLINLLCHAIATVLLAMIARRLGLSSGAAFAAGAIFAIHPLHIDAIAPGVGRADLLLGALCFGAFLLWEKEKTAFSMILLCLALLSKEMSAVFALVLVWRDWTKNGFSLRPSRVGWRWLWPVGIIAIWLAARYYILGSLGNAQPSFLENPVMNAPFSTRLWTAFHLYARILGLYVAPVILRADYSYATILPITGPTLSSVIGGLALLGTIAATIVTARKAPVISLILAIWVGPFLLVSHLGPTMPMIFAERVFYLPSAGLSLLVGYLLSRLAPWPRWEKAAGVFVLVACMALAVRSVTRVGDWRDNATLLERTLEDSPRCVKWLAATPEILLDQGRIDSTTAVMYINRALEIYDDHFLIHVEAAKLYISMGRQEIATRHIERASELSPKEARVFTAKCAYATRFTPGEAIPLCKKVAKMPKSGSNDWMLLGMAYDQAGDVANAEIAFKRAMDTFPRPPSLLFNYGVFLARHRRFDEARSMFLRTLKKAPGHRKAARYLKNLTPKPSPMTEGSSY